MQLVAKLARCRISSDVYTSGDDILLPNITIFLGEDQRSSTCSFSVNDPGLLIGARYREISVKQGGIQVPAELVESKKEFKAATTAVAASASSSSASSNGTQGATPTTGTSGHGVVITGDPRFTPEVKAFMDAIAYGEVEDKLGINGYSEGNNGEKNLIKNNQFPPGSYTTLNVGRYQFSHDEFDEFLATNPPVKDFSPLGQDLMCYWRMGKNQRNVLEPLLKGDLDTAMLRAGKEWASIPGSPYGQVHLTKSQWVNYYNQRLAYYRGQQPTPSPPAAAAPMSPTPATTTPPVAQIPPPQESSIKGTEIIIELAVGYGATWKDAIAFHFIHTETKTEWGADGRQITTFTGKSIRWLLTRVPVTQSFENITLKQFTEMQLSGFNLKLEMEGKGLTYQHLSQDGQVPLDILFREAKRMGFRVAEGVGKKSDTLIVEPLGRPEFTNVIIDEEILIKPAIFTDKARANKSGAPAATISDPMTGTGETKTAIDRASGNMTQVKPESKAGTGQPSGGITGAAIALVGGTVKPDPMGSSTTATKPDPMGGDKSKKPAAAPTGTSQNDQAGNTTHKVEGPVKVTKPDGTVVSTTVTTDQKIETGKITRTKTTVSIVTKPRSQPQATTKKVVTEVTDGKTKTTTILTEPGKQPQTTTKEENKVSAEDQKLLEQSKVSSNQSDAAGTGATAPANVDPVTGLPNQQPGFIDLRDGRAEAEVIADESRRVKGYEDSYVLVMNADTLQLVPGQIVALSKRLFPDAFATEKRIAQVDHNFDAGTTTINTYTPQAQLPEGAGGGGAGAIATPAPTASAAPTQFATPSAPPGQFCWPIPRGATTIGDGYGPRASRPPSYRHTILDITAPQGTVAVAMADGVVSIQPDNGGAGNMMTIKHGGGYECVYMHGMPGGYIVTSGPVKQGQPIFKIGTTGGSSGPHLHVKFTLNGTYCLLSKVGLDPLKQGLPVQRYNSGCTAY